MRMVPKSLLAVGIVVLVIAVLVVMAGVAELVAAPRLLAAHPTPSATPTATPAAGAKTKEKATRIAPRTLAGAATAADAQVLGITRQQLGTDLKQGQTVSALAAQKNLSQQAFSSAFTQAVTPLLNADVTQGLITQKQEQAALKLWAKTPPHWKAPTKKKQPSPSPSPS